ncbi:MAG TPA: RAD55 family ATPase [Candidatus Nanoarchaeia archaeon]|nr:RAD55 family ATPase [Candidatus Nanoarchaeia archaeon]
MSDLIPTGINKVDSMLKGGLLPGSNVTITGMPGSGKSLFIHKMVYQLLASGHPVVYITTDRSIELLMSEVKNLKLDYNKYFKSGQLVLIDVYSGKAVVNNSRLSADIRDLTSVSLLVDKVVDCFNGKQVVQVYDVLTHLFIWTSNTNTILQFISNACARTHTTKGLSFFVINEGTQNPEYLKSIESITEGVIELGSNDADRWLKIVKMRGVSVSSSKQKFKINRSSGVISFLSK